MATPIPWLTAYLDVPADRSPDAERFWLAVTRAHLSSRRGGNQEFVTLLPDEGDAYLRMQRIDEGSGGVHLDLYSPDPEGLAEHAVSLGAIVTHTEPGFLVLTSPGGLPWCAVEHHGETTVPAPVRPAGKDTTAPPARVDRVVLFYPPDILDAEAAFWAAVTGWVMTPGDETPGDAPGARPSTAPVGRELSPPPGFPRPLTLLLESRPGPPTVVIEMATGSRAGVEQTAAAHERLGAARVASAPSTDADVAPEMRAPGGTPYQLTPRDPGNRGAHS